MFLVRKIKLLCGSLLAYLLVRIVEYTVNLFGKDDNATNIAIIVLISLEDILGAIGQCCIIYTFWKQPDWLNPYCSCCSTKTDLRDYTKINDDKEELA